MKLLEKTKILNDKTKIKHFVFSLAPEDLKLIYEGLCFAQLHYLNILEDKAIIKNYFKTQIEFNKINLTIDEIKKHLKKIKL